MKPTLTLLLCTLGSAALAQNDWRPIRLGDQYNYESCQFFTWAQAPFLQSTCIHSIWTDSVGIENGDSVFYLNRRLHPHHFDTLVLGSHFVQARCLQRNDGSYWFVQPDSFVLYPQAQLSDTWNFTPTGSITATVVLADIQTLPFGVSDSMKRAILSTGDTLEWSKAHGILRFPNFNTGPDYQLKSIEGTRVVGEPLDDWRDFFDYNVGDVLCYHMSDQNAWVNYFRIIKHTILEDLSTPDSLIYRVRGLSYYQDYYFGAVAPIISIDTFLIFFSETTIQTPAYTVNFYGNTYSANQRPWELFLIQYPWGEDAYSFLSLGRTSQGLMLHSTQACLNRVLGTNYYILCQGPIGQSLQPYSASWGRNGGLWQIRDGQNGNNLIGYYNSQTNDTTGNIISDAFFLTHSTAPEILSIRLFPNPAQTTVWLEGATEGEVSIYNLDGRWMQTQPITADMQSIGIEQLPNGIYIVQLRNQRGVGIQKLLVQRPD